MFKFLKEKLKDALSKFSKDVDEETEVENAAGEEVLEEERTSEDFTKAGESEEKKSTSGALAGEETVKEHPDESKEKAEHAESGWMEEERPEEEKGSEKDAGEDYKSYDKESDGGAEKEERADFRGREDSENEVGDLRTESGSEKKEPEEEKESRGVFKRIFGRKKESNAEESGKVKALPEELPEEIPKDLEEESGDRGSAKRGVLSKIKNVVTEKVVKKSLSEEKFEELFWDLELVLLENNVAVEVIEKIKHDLKGELVESRVIRGRINEVISSTLRKSIEELFVPPEGDLLEIVEKKKPFIILFLGVNGSGKTTNLAKIASYLQGHGKSVVIAAADTFRAAAIQQIEEHARKLGVKLIKHEYGSDAAAVAFDAVKHAEAKGKDVVLIDTAGRSHSNVNLMDELKKVVRVAKPDMKIFVGDSLTGNDAVQQAAAFDKAVGIDGVILTKLDVDEKGGAAISVSYVTRKPILFVGTGQSYGDIKPFDKDQIVANLGLEV